MKHFGLIIFCYVMLPNYSFSQTDNVAVDTDKPVHIFGAKDEFIVSQSTRKSDSKEDHVFGPKDEYISPAILKPNEQRPEGNEYVFGKKDESGRRAKDTVKNTKKNDKDKK